MNRYATQARGAHTKVTSDNAPSTTEFAEAFLDWYMIGETDAVVAEMSRVRHLAKLLPLARLGRIIKYPRMELRAARWRLGTSGNL